MKALPLLASHTRSGVASLVQPLRGIWPGLGDAFTGMCALLVVALALLSQSATLTEFSSRFFSGNRYFALASGMLNPFRNQQVLLKSGFPIYDLKIAHQEYARLEETVQKARNQGWMSEDLRAWANAKFLYGNAVYNVKVRIRGDLPSHWEGAKKSWRIKFSSEYIEEESQPSTNTALARVSSGKQVKKEAATFEGKHQINLILPNDRDYVLSAFVNSVLRDTGMVVPRDRFVILRINGVVQGLYYEIEHFDKPLLASHQRPETTVFGQNDRAMHFEQYTREGTAGASDANFDIAALRRLVDTQGDLGVRAMKVLMDYSVNPTPEQFRRVRDVVDWERYLRLSVLTVLCNTNHAKFGSDNLRLYYDESRGLLEPIPWDLHLTRMPNEPGTVDFWNTHGPDPLEMAILRDPQLRRQRDRLLWALVDDGGKRILAKYDAWHQAIRPLAWADVLAVPLQGYKMDVLREVFEHNVRRVHKVLSLTTGTLTYALKSNTSASLELSATNFSGLRFQRLELSDPVLDGEYELYEDSDGDGELSSQDRLLAVAASAAGTVAFDLNREILPEFVFKSDWIENRQWFVLDPRAGRARFLLVGKLAAGNRDPIEWKPPAIRATASNPVTGLQVSSAPAEDGAAGLNSVGVLAYDASDFWDLDAIHATSEEFLRKHPQFRQGREEPDTAELSGDVSISGTVIVPAGLRLVIRPGANIAMGERASIVAYGGLEIKGSESDPIRIHAGPSGRPWGVLAVVRPKQKVIAGYVEVSGASQAQINGILFTGGFAVHNGDLQITHCKFTAMQSEDSLTLKNGRIEMSDCLFEGAASDAIDLDFVTGEIRNSVLRNNAGDGIDMSGSKVLITANWMEGMKDKCISVGEDSHPVILNNLLRNCQIAISTKDLSWPQVAYNTFVGNQLAIEAKRKKAMFGPGGGEFVNNVFSANKVLLSEDNLSRGRTLISYSLLDTPLRSCTTCQMGGVHFRAPEAGDYRLSAAGASKSQLASPSWLHAIPQPPPDTVAVAGVYSHISARKP